MKQNCSYKFKTQMSTKPPLTHSCATAEIYMCALLKPLSRHTVTFSILKSVHTPVSAIMIWKASFCQHSCF